MPLLDRWGKPIDMSAFKKAAPPTLGEKFGNWTGRQFDILQLPGGGILQFDLNKLRLTDYRSMRTHYQVNSSLSVLSFMLHQSNWTIEHDNPKVVDQLTENLGEIWTQLNRGLSQANWAGFSPNVLQFENDPMSGYTIITKVKDLIPEECAVQWKKVDGATPKNGGVAPKIPVYDGIRQMGWPEPIPAENTLWYPILMESGDYYGSKLLKSAYTSYFFSMLMHLFSNRYYERFGEPVPIGRAPQDESVSVPNGEGGYTSMPAHEYMLFQLQQLRSRSTVVLPSDRDMDTNGRGYFDYDLQYLESQMRGADFERYMQRLDEEISLAIFTPVLLMKTADVGSYNLGVGHMQMYLWMLNALNADRKMYIDRYVLAPLTRFNFGQRIKPAKIKFNKLDNTNAQLVQLVIQALIGKDKIELDLVQLGEMSGLTIKQAKQTLKNPTGMQDDPNNPPEDTSPIPSDSKNAAKVVRQKIYDRVRKQVERAFREGEFDSRNFKVSLGYQKQLIEAFVRDGVRDAPSAARAVYAKTEMYAADLVGVPDEMTPTPDEFNRELFAMLDHELEAVST